MLGENKVQWIPILEPPRELEFGLNKIGSLRKSKASSNDTWFTLVLFHEKQKGT